jgi:hypothetical protein
VATSVFTAALGLNDPRKVREIRVEPDVKVRSTLQNGWIAQPELRAIHRFTARIQQAWMLKSH